MLPASPHRQHCGASGNAKSVQLAVTYIVSSTDELCKLLQKIVTPLHWNKAGCSRNLELKIPKS